MIKIQKLKIVLVVCILSFVAIPVFAADIFLDAKNQSLTQGEEFLMNVFMNTEEESVNAIEGRVVFPADLLEAREIRDGNSSINFWIEKPHSSQAGVIAFSGITPGGLSGPKEILFSVVFRAEKEGSGVIQTDGLRVLRNDGAGTSASVKVSPLQFSISQKSSSIPQVIEPIKDTEPPEDFKPTIESDPSIFYGKYFLVFATQDKISGIANYKVREGEWGWFSVAESPYLLKHQTLDRKIFVKVIDKASNERVAAVEPRYPMKWYEQLLVWVIIAIVGMIVYLIWRKSKNR